jgi:two-component system chemotaxis response regulator CheB
MAAGTPEDPIRVLVVDDSPVARMVIISHLSRDCGITVVGEAENGIEALRKVLELKPDLVTIDIQMPVMSGLTAIEHIMAQSPVPILVLTALDDAETAFAALAKGALEVMEKPNIDRSSSVLAGKIKALAGVKAVTPVRRDWMARPARPRGERPSAPTGAPRRVVAIASSTGGPKALSVILSSLPADLRAPVLVAQHMSEGFTDGMVQWLNMNSRLAVHMAVHGEVISAGRVYVSPSELNMSVSPSGEIILSERRKHDIYQPCCDVLLESVADVYASKAIGVILTGMGNDGVSGIARIREAGGVTIAQDERSSVIFGMPKAAIEKGCVTIVLPLDKIAPELVKQLWFDVPAYPGMDRRSPS